MSQLMYLISVIPNPSESMKKDLENILFKYLWNGKQDKIKRKFVMSPTSRGGLGFPHVESQFISMKCAWIKRLVSDSSASWKEFIKPYLPCPDDFIWSCNIHVNDAEGIFSKVKNLFWKQVFESWCKFNFHTPCTVREMLNQTIWFNSHINIGGTVIYYKRWFEKGIRFFKDLIGLQGRTYTVDEFNENRTPALLVLVDFEKAFDKLEWKFISRCLNYFNFGPSLIRWIQMFYNNIQSCVINNGWASEAFNLTCGVHQGCPISLYFLDRKSVV